MIPVAITTAPREGVCYLPRTIASVVEAGFWKPLVFAEPLAPVPNGYVTLRAVDPLGPWPNLLRAVRVLARNPRADFVAVFQDDVLVARGCRAWVEGQVASGDVRADVVSLYTARSVAEGRAPGWFLLEGEALRNPYGACAVLFSRRATELLDAEPPSERHVKGIGADTRLGQFCRRHGLAYAQHVPSLVRHVGAVTSIPRGKDRSDPGLNRDRREGPFVEDVAEL